MTMTESRILEYLLLANNSVMGYQICEGGGELMGSKIFWEDVRNKCERPLAGHKIQGLF